MSILLRPARIGRPYDGKYPEDKCLLAAVCARSSYQKAVENARINQPGVFPRWKPLPVITTIDSLARA